jgi:hypothetical protein
VSPIPTQIPHYNPFQKSNPNLNSPFQSIPEDLTASQHKLYKEAWEEAGQRSRSGKGEEWTVVGPKSKPRLLPKRRLEEGNRMSRDERKEAEQEKFDKISKKVLRNGMVQRMVERVHEIQDAEDAEQGL